MTPTLASQHREIALIVTPGLNGYRLSFVGGVTFDTEATYPTIDAAYSAQKMAVEMTARVLAKLSITKGTM